ncbi:MAG: ParB N-terminal domain-containing protein [Oscillatoriales cyanobacterium C42_A2020_001]|nr:ParB N-terminal domain-containing protein [Leptolyngbyaceae cyanobacterium C42_A2020_001]
MPTKPSAREFFSSSQKNLDAQLQLKQQIEALETERTQLLQKLEQAVGSQSVSEGIEVPIAQIKRRPYRSRREKDPVAHAELVESIRNYGFRGSIWVQRLADGSLRLIAGESRLDAAIAAGLESIKVDIVETDDITAVKLSRIENARRRNLNELDDTKELLYLLSLTLDMSEAEVVKLLYQMKNAVEGKAPPIPADKEQVIHAVFTDVAPDISWQSFISVRLRLLNLPEDVLAVYNSGQLAYTKALAIAQMNDDHLRKQLLELAVAEDWTLETLKAQIKQLQSNPIRALSSQERSHPVVSRLEKMENQLKTITVQKVNKMSPDQQQRLLNAIERMEQLLQAKKMELMGHTLQEAAK